MITAAEAETVVEGRVVDFLSCLLDAQGGYMV